ncbi:MAG: hypothetical protein DDT26_00880 [Dehalococcoidia bacterium]|nr:hypothetical protein [Chloroflexota bacterium]
MSSNLGTSRPIMAILLLGLAGCSSGPSSSDVRDALERDIERANQQILEMGGRAARNIQKNELTELKVLGCEPAGEAFKCDIVYSMKTPFIPVDNVSISVRLRQGDSGWRIVGGLGGMGQ